MNINDIFKEADALIKKASATERELPVTKTASINREVSDLAKEILDGDHDFADVAPMNKVATQEMTPMEKAAHSMAIVDTLLNLSSMAKLEKIAQVAEEQGYSEKQIGQYLEKKAQELPLMSVAALIKENFEGGESEKTAGIRGSLGKLVTNPKVTAGLGLGAGLLATKPAYDKGSKDTQKRIRGALARYYGGA